MFQIVTQDFSRIVIPAKDRELSIHIEGTPFSLYDYCGRKTLTQKSVKDEQLSLIIKQGDKVESSIYAELFNGLFLLGVYDCRDTAQRVLIHLSNYLSEQSSFIEVEDEHTYILLDKFVMPDFSGVSQIDKYKNMLLDSPAPVSE